MKVTVSKEHHRNEKIRVMPRGKITVEFQEVTHPHKMFIALFGRSCDCCCGDKERHPQ
jgi:hypothetical protein